MNEAVTSAITELPLSVDVLAMPYFQNDDHDLCLGDAIQNAKPPSPITFLSDDVDQTYEVLRNRGVQFDQEPQHAEWGSYAVFSDVDGNSFVLSSK